MNIVLIHIGGEFPSYTKYCIEQIRKWYGGELFFCCEELALTDELTRLSSKYSAHIVCSSALEPVAQRQFFEVGKWLHDFGMNGFWSVTMHRLYLLEDLMRTFKLRNVIHIENDVLIYHDPAKLAWFPRSVAINEISDKHAGFAYMMASDHEALHETNQKMLEILKQGKDILRRRYGETIISEMMIGSEMLKRGDFLRLPTLPNRCAEFLYDGSAYGQFIGGTPNDPPGWAERERYVGEAILDGRIEIAWSIDDRGKRYPFVVDTEEGGKYRLANLHIHSKKLQEWMS